MTVPAPHRDVHADVRAHYSQAARNVNTSQSTCCSPNLQEIEPGLAPTLYDPSQRDELPVTAVAASLGCGNPTAVAELAPGERVLDLGSGGGIDVLLSARRVGPTGFAYGLDMTEEMLELARRSASEAGVSNVEFVHGKIEAIPLPDGSVDVIISNCVVNLSPDKAAVLSEAARVLVPGGRVGITDIVADEGLTEQERAERGSWAGCIAGALTVTEYQHLLTAAGFVDIEITRTHEVVPGMSSAIVRARTPGG